ncbi:MAG: family 20 glycosylhydrolase [Bacteroidales bacterium]|nr:family 20 glycosylhydrolase [Bacteroidales bacterium]
MKKSILTSVILFIGLIVFSQETGIIPEPQQVEYQKGCFLWDSDYLKNEKRIKTKLVRSISAKENESQAYIIKITPKKIVLQATTEQGLFYARQSLNQIIKYQNVTTNKSEFEIPCMTITDWPALEYRGWMDDISRGPIPTVEFIKKEIRTLASYKMNFFQLYTEHVFKLESHPDIAPADGLTAQEIKELTDYAKQFYVEFMGNQQCFAHAEKTLMIQHYYDEIGDTRNNFDPSNPKTYKFLEDVFSEVAPAYESEYFNINCDETEGLGSGKAKEYIEKVGKDEAYCEHINKVYDILKKHGKTILMWGDIIAKNPSMIDKLPEDMQFVVWSYGASDSFTEMLRPFQESGHTFWAATGANCWSTVFPDIQTYMKNIANFARDAYVSGAKGLMNTAWDDYGESMFSSTWHSMIWAAETAWHPKTGLEYEDNFNKLFEIQYFNKKTENNETVAAFYNLNEINMSFDELDKPLLEFYPDQVSNESILKFVSIKDKSNSIYKNISKLINDENHDDDILRCAQTAAFRIYVTECKNILKAQIYNTLQNPNIENANETKKAMTDFSKELTALKDMTCRLWDTESRAYSRDIVEARFDKIIQDINDTDKKVFISNELQDGTPVISLKTIFNDKNIYYTTDGSEPDRNSQLYTRPFAISNSCVVKAISYDENGGSVVSERKILYHKGIGHLKRLNSPVGYYRPEYSGGGDDALLNGVTGGNNYKDGNWQGFYGCNADIELDFGKAEVINSLTINFMANPFDWIMLPSKVQVYAFPVDDTPDMPDTWVKTFTFDDKVPMSGNNIFTKTLDLKGVKTKYLRVTIENPGVLPAGTPGAGNDSWIFMDEIIVE